MENKDFLEYLKITVSKSTYNNYEKCYQKIEEMGIDDTEEIYKKIRQMKSTKQNNYIRALNHYEKYLGTEKVWKRTKVRVEDQREKEDYLRVEEIQEMIRTAKTIRIKAEISIMFGTGLRVGELVKIKHKNLDIKEKRIIGVKAKGNKRTNAYFVDNYFLGIVLDYLQWKKSNELYKNLCKEEDYIFCDGKGKEYRTETVWYDIKRTSRVLKNKKSISPHTLRHSFVYLAMEKGIPQDAISKNIGHASTQITEQVYTHYNNDLQQKRFFGNLNNENGKNEKATICPNCGFNEIKEDYRLCPNCEIRLKVLCDICKEAYKIDFKNCPYCGKKNAFFMFEKLKGILEKKESIEIKVR